jgi:hypothetical protein
MDLGREHLSTLLAVLAQEAGSGAAGQFFITWAVIGGIGHALLQPFARRIGGNQAADGGPGGSEKGIVGVIWFLAALATGIYMAR